MDSSAEDRWTVLLGSLDPSALADAFMANLAEVPGYDPPPLPREEMALRARAAFSALIAAVRSEDPQRTRAVAREIGVTRARIGIPLASLMAAMRIDFMLIWESIESASCPEDARLILIKTRLIMRVVDSFSAELEQAYLSERHRIETDQASERHRLVARVIGGNELQPMEAADISHQLGLPPSKPIRVYAASPDHSLAIQRILGNMSRLGYPFHTQHRGAGIVAFGFAPDLPGSEVERTLFDLHQLAIGVDISPNGIVGVKAAAAIASALMESRRPEDLGALDWRAGWHRVVSMSTTQPLRQRLARDANEALDQCRLTERSRLMETAVAFLRTGSLTACAEALYCHRNTVSNRLQRFREVTGIDLSSPRDAAALVLAWC